MIQKMKPDQLDAVMKIWLEENIAAHPFIAASFWQEHFTPVKQMLPDADIWVYQQKGEVQGFIGIAEKTLIAGLFVSGKSQSKGIGSALIQHCKQLTPVLTLEVYEKNTKALNFYQKQGFHIVTKQENPDTAQAEYEMRWEQPASD